jgi:hypothetical protein
LDNAGAAPTGCTGVCANTIMVRAVNAAKTKATFRSASADAVRYTRRKTPGSFRIDMKDHRFNFAEHNIGLLSKQNEDE